MKEFIEPTPPPPPAADEPLPSPETDVEDTPPELDVQKAVVEELAAEKVELHEQIAARDKELAALKEQLNGANMS